VGSSIREGQTLCIIEAMKLMNEIEADAAGTIVEILAENGKPVEFGQKLFKVRRG
jgi:biotin carboxyl carrier protein